MDEERIIKSATGIHNTVVWKKLFRFQRDGVVGAIDRTALVAASLLTVGARQNLRSPGHHQYHELRNDRVLVLAPKRLRGQLDAHKANDKAQHRLPLTGSTTTCSIPHRPVARWWPVG